MGGNRRQLTFWDVMPPVDAAAELGRARRAAAEAVAEFPSLARLQLHVEFYPYCEVKATTRMRDGALYVRLAQSFGAARREVVRAAVRILLSKLRRRAPRPADEALFSTFAESEEARARLAPPRPVAMGKPRGEYYDLSAMFRRLNERLFAGRLPAVELGWSDRFRRRLGCYYPDRNLILLSRQLDDSRVSRLLVEFILFHEMLHKKHGYEIGEAGRRYHTPAFRRAEKTFPQYEEAMRLYQAGLPRRGRKG